MEEVKPEDVKIDYSVENQWNCDKCIFFKAEECECRSVKRLLFGQALGDDCSDCKYPFVLINPH